MTAPNERPPLLMIRIRRRDRAVMIGQLILIDRIPWVVTGCNSNDQTVYIARDRTLRTVLAEDIGMRWEVQP